MEQRLIDANALYDKVEANYRMSEGVQHVCEREFLNLLCYAPTVDAVPVVRCKECKYHEVFKNGVNGWCNGHGFPTDVTYFCADGEREDDER